MDFTVDSESCRINRLITYDNIAFLIYQDQIGYANLRKVHGAMQMSMGITQRSLAAHNSQWVQPEMIRQNWIANRDLRTAG
jgi:hypothetical protein